MRIVQPGNDIDLRGGAHAQCIVPQVQPEQHLRRDKQERTKYVKNKGRDVDLGRNRGGLH